MKFVGIFAIFWPILATSSGHYAVNYLDDSDLTLDPFFSGPAWSLVTWTLSQFFKAQQDPFENIGKMDPKLAQKLEGHCAKFVQENAEFLLPQGEIQEEDSGEKQLSSLCLFACSFSLLHVLYDRLGAGRAENQELFDQILADARIKFGQLATARFPAGKLDFDRMGQPVAKAAEMAEIQEAPLLFAPLGRAHAVALLLATLKAYFPKTEQDTARIGQLMPQLAIGWLQAAHAIDEKCRAEKYLERPIALCEYGLSVSFLRELHAKLFPPNVEPDPEPEDSEMVINGSDMDSILAWMVDTFDRIGAEFGWHFGIFTAISANAMAHVDLLDDLRDKKNPYMPIYAQIFGGENKKSDKVENGKPEEEGTCQQGQPKSALNLDEIAKDALKLIRTEAGLKDESYAKDSLAVKMGWSGELQQPKKAKKKIWPPPFFTKPKRCW